LKKCLTVEYRLIMNLLRGGDFKEGVRHVYVYIYIHIYIYIFIYIYVYMNIYIYIYTYTYIYLFTYMCIWIYVYVYIFTYMCIWIHILSYMYGWMYAWVSFNLYLNKNINTYSIYSPPLFSIRIFLYLFRWELLMTRRIVYTYKYIYIWFIYM
jgi:hypothetical protein